MSQSVTASLEADFRSSQRTSRRCTECARRKTKCSLDIPCSACVQRGISDQCQREIVRVGGRLMGGDTILTKDHNTFNTISTSTISSASPTGHTSTASSPPAEVAALRARVQELETTLDDFLQQQSRTQREYNLHALPDAYDGMKPVPYKQTKKFTDPRAGPGRSEDRALLHPTTQHAHHAALPSQPLSRPTSTHGDASMWYANVPRSAPSYSPESLRSFPDDIVDNTLPPLRRPLPRLSVCERCRKHNLECNGLAPCTSCFEAAVTSCSFDPFRSMSVDDLASHVMTYRSLVGVLTTVDDPMAIVRELKRGTPTAEIVERYRRWGSRERPRWE